MAETDMKVIFCTPTATPPAWLTNRYPEVLNCNMDGVPYRHGARRHYNYNSPVYLNFCKKIVEKSAAHYGPHPSIIGWQIDNELNCEMDEFYSCEQRAKWLLADIWRLPQGSNTPLQSSGVFDSESDTVAFRNFLKEKYGSIDALNDAWGTVFWNQTYTCFGEIYVPRKTLSNSTNPHQVLEHHYPHAVILTKERMEEILCGKREEGGVTLEKYGVKVYKI